MNHSHEDWLHKKINEINDKIWENSGIKMEDVINYILHDTPLPNNQSTLDFDLGDLFDDNRDKNVDEPKKPKWKIYQDLSYLSSVESVHCTMLIQALEAKKKLLDAQTEYFDTMSNIECDNEMFGFYLNL